jgi:hypothetical protein
MKRNYQVKVIGYPPFTMLLMDGEETPEQICQAIFNGRLEWVK